MPYELERQFRADDIVDVYGAAPQTFTIYTKEEANERGLDYVYWMDCEPGDWALSDDDYVALCLRHRQYKGHQGPTIEYTFPYAKKMRTTLKDGELSRAGILHFWDRWELGQGWSYQRPETWVQHITGHSNVKAAVNLYARLWLAREGDLTEGDWHAVGLQYRHHDKIPKASAKRLIRQKEIQEMVSDKLRDLLVGEGLDEQEILAMYRESYEQAKHIEQPSVMKSVADSLAKMLDMTPDKTRVTESYEELVSYEQLGRSLEAAEAEVVELPEPKPVLQEKTQ